MLSKWLTWLCGSLASLKSAEQAQQAGDSDELMSYPWLEIYKADQAGYKLKQGFYDAFLRPNAFFWKPQSFFLLKPSTNLMRPTHTMEGDLPYVRSTNLKVNHI